MTFFFCLPPFMKGGKTVHRFWRKYSILLASINSFEYW